MAKNKQSDTWERPKEKGFNHLLGYSLEYPKVKTPAKEKPISTVSLPKMNRQTYY